MIEIRYQNDDPICVSVNVIEWTTSDKLSFPFLVAEHVSTRSRRQLATYKNKII